MMKKLETVSVASCMDNLISAYRDGGAITQRVKATRNEKQAPLPPAALEQLIEKASEEIEQERKRGISSFGHDFEEGDHVSVIALQQITIELQSLWLGKLREATCDYEYSDFTSLTDAISLARDKTIATLVELSQRLSQAEPAHNLLVPGQKPSHEPSRISLKRHRTWTRERSPSEQDHGDGETTTGAADDTTGLRYVGRHHHSGLLNALKGRRGQGGSERPNPESDEPRHLSGNLEALPFRDSVDSQRNQSSPMNGQITDSVLGISDSPTEQSAHHRDTVTSTSPRSKANSQSTAASSSLFETQSRAPSNTPLSNNLQPSPENNFLGFCKCAVQLQNGDRKALQTSKEFNDGWSQTKVYYLSCSNSKCAFAGHIDVNVIWTKVWKAREAQGIKFRWVFLAKSHICESKVRYDQQGYRCLFCVFLGYRAPVIHGTDRYLDHISQDHRGRILSDVVLYKTGCVSDRACDDGEEFDINLFPLTSDEHAKLEKQNERLSDEIVVSPPRFSSDGQDSTISDEPWNEGLSDFHYSEGSELERMETLRSFRSHSFG